MGRIPKQTFFLKRHTDGQQAHEKKMLNIGNYCINANQNYIEVPPHTSGHHYKSPKTNAGEGVEKKEPSYTVGWKVNWYNNCYGKQGDNSEN